MIFDDTRENGYVQIRRNLLSHLQDKRMTLNEYLVFHVLLLTASTSTGEAKTCASAISLSLAGHINEKMAQRALRGLESKGYISRVRKEGERGIYSVLIHNFLLTTGLHAGQHTAVLPAKCNSGVNCAVHSNVTERCTDEGTHRNGYSVTDERPVSLSGSGDYGAIDGSTVTHPNRYNGTHVVTERCLEVELSGVLSGAPIQESKANGKGKENKLAVFSPSPDSDSETASEIEDERGAGAEPRITEEKREREIGPVIPKASVRVALTPAQMIERNVPKSRPATQTPQPVALVKKPEVIGFQAADPADPYGYDRGSKLYREMYPVQVTEDNFNGLDYAFTRKEDIAGFSPKEIRRIGFFHWRVAKKKYWSTSEARIDSPARFDQMLPKMAKQVPEHFRLTGEATAKFTVWPASCTVCDGRGGEVVPHDSYPVEMGFTMWAPCKCQVEHPAPWRVVGTEAGV